MLYFGAAYYPEVWEEEKIEKDIERAKRLGLNAFRIGEFNWAKLEPEEGVFCFDWLERLVDKLYTNGIYTILGTPTCCPPRWMFKKYPDARSENYDGKKTEINSRCHTCKTSVVMREKNRIIVTELARRFQGNPGVIGWQIDNEISFYGGCYCKECKSAFKNYLKVKYRSVKELNKRWKLARWSLTYDSFDDILPPDPKGWNHPSLLTAWRNFYSEQIFSYTNEQIEIIHLYSDAPVGVNLLPNNILSYYRINEETDVVLYDHYDTAEQLQSSAFPYDFLRAMKKKPFRVIETQVGWNGGVFADSGYRPENNCYINTLLPFMKGADANMYWLFRAFDSGHEMAHGALYSQAGRLYRTSEEVKRAIDDLKKCENFLLHSWVHSDIALHYSSTAANNFASARTIKDFDYRKTIIDIYLALGHRNIDVIDTAHDFDGYRVVVSPFVTTMEEYGFRSRIIEWIKNGGTWIVGPLSDCMLWDTVRYTSSPFSFLEELCGVYTKYQLPVSNEIFKGKWNDGEQCDLSLYYDAFECKDSVPLVTYRNGEFKGLAAIVERKVGKGKVILLGSLPSEKDFIKLIETKPILDASNNLVVIERTGKENGIVLVETKNKPGWFVLDGSYKDLISGQMFEGKCEICAYGALVLKRED